ncbi:hypothetical protein Hypma_013242 [Hypsizygus marmoreus]|uniref:Uncharacterized protein n=1 Tax=Hypsizygus marmoreus TaxID=39966 RepID=A0A369JGW5_HYPMA|nr:hypothetical protein Hypma_013242 [Hypsizygus marmoreus]
MPAPSNLKPKKATKTQKKFSKDDYTRKKAATTVKKKEHGKAKKTTENYDGHIQRGRKYLTRFSKEEGEAEENWQAGQDEKLSGENEDLEGDEETRLHPSFHKAFDGKPLECMPLTISMFMSEKCFKEKHGISTVHALHAAFKLHYERL